MDAGKLNEWVQVVGLFALVASLVFIGLQMKQAQEIALSTAAQSRWDTAIQITSASAEKPYFLSAAAKMAMGESDAISMEEKISMGQTATAMMYCFENTVE